MEMAKHGETWDELLSATLNPSQLEAEFDNSYGHVTGEPFTAWTANRVYFPIQYDGSEWCGSTPRNPCNEATEHQGG